MDVGTVSLGVKTTAVWFVRKDSNGERKRWVGQMETANQEETLEIKSTNR